MREDFIRTISLVGEDKFARLENANVAVFGLGGVGGYVCEGLARCGVGKLTICDCDEFSESNLNRQVLAAAETIGKRKTDVAKARIESVNQKAEVTAVDGYFSVDSAGEFDFSAFDFVVDAIDSVTSKILLAKLCSEAGVEIISCMGTGNKTDPSLLKVSMLSKTSGCPLARVMRRELKKLGLDILVVYSTEEAKKPEIVFSDEKNLRKDVPSSMVFVPAVAGLMLAREVCFRIMERE